MNMLDTLNERQRQAATAADVPVLIIAGPGTGKTKTLIARICYLLHERQLDPATILALTFTNKAAREMQERLRLSLGERASLPTVTTFHALGADVLRRSGNTRRLLTDDEQQRILGALPRPAAAKRMSARELGLRISAAKTSLQPPTDAILVELLAAYEAVLQAQDAQDFDDLLCRTYDLQLAGHVVTYAHVLVDEFQDTSELQYEMLRLFAPHRTIFAIGDPKQSIYAFRGAGAEMFTYFARDYPDAHTVALVENYRSCPEVVRVSNAVFPNSPQLIPMNRETGTVRVVRTLHEYSEAAYVLQEIEAAIGGSDMLKAAGEQQVRQPRDFAVLYRTHRVAHAVQKAFSAAGIPYQVAGEGSPYEQPDLRAIIAGLRYVYDPVHAALPERAGLSEQHARMLLGHMSCPDDMPASDLPAALATALGIDINDAVRQLQSMMVQFGAGRIGLAAALAHLEEIGASEFYDPSVNAVTLMTIHAAKGLEFGHVFLIGAEEGVLPKLSQQGTISIDEERRLLYVAVTRSKDALDIVYTKVRGTNPAILSRFIREIPNVLLPRIDDPNLAILEKRHQKRAARRAQVNLF